MMIKQLAVVVLVVGISLAYAGGFAQARDLENYSDSLRKYHQFIDSLDKAPAWIRAQVLERHRNDKLFVPDSQNVRCVGRWPFGPSYQVTGQDSFVYLGSGSGVRIINISDPRRPRHVGKVDALGLVGYGGGVVRKDSLLYVLSGSCGLQIFNITNPASPRELGRLAILGYHQDLTIKDSLVYVVGWDSLLRVISVSNPSNPQQVGSLKFNNDTWGVDVKDSLAYVANQTSGLRVVNVADSRNPREVGSISSWRALEVYASANLAYVAAGAAGLRIVDVRNPANPQEIGYLLSTPCRDVMRIGMFAYAIRDSDDCAVFYIIDVSDSTNPNLISFADPKGWGSALWVLNPYAYAYTADHWEGMHVVNINDPTRPRVDTVCFGAHSARDVFTLGNRTYLADDMAGLKVLDISNISNPIEIGCYDSLGQFPYGFEAIWARDSLTYLGNDLYPLEWRFAIVNTNNPTNIRRIGYSRCISPSVDMFLKAGDSVLYSVTQSFLCGFKIINPNSPIMVCSLLVGTDQAYGVFVKDTLAYVEGMRGLKIINVSNPANPVIVGQCSTHGGLAIYVKDSIAYAGCGTLGLVIVNVANPNSPFEITRFPTRHWAYDVWVEDSLAYVDARAYLQVVNVRDPSNPFEIAYYSFYSPSRRLFYDSRYIYTANYEGGMFILEQFNTGIQESFNQPSLFKSFAAYPNPTRGRLFLKFAPFVDDSKFSLFDVTGRAIINKRPLTKLNLKDGFDIGFLKSGVYFLIFESQKYKTTTKVVKISGGIK